MLTIHLLFIYLLFVYLYMLGLEPTALYMLGNCSTTEPPPFILILRQDSPSLTLNLQSSWLYDF